MKVPYTIQALNAPDRRSAALSFLRMRAGWPLSRCQVFSDGVSSQDLLSAGSTRISNVKSQHLYSQGHLRPNDEGTENTFSCYPLHRCRRGHIDLGCDREGGLPLSISAVLQSRRPIMLRK